MTSRISETANSRLAVTARCNTGENTCISLVDIPLPLVLLCFHIGVICVLLTAEPGEKAETWALFTLLPTLLPFLEIVSQTVGKAEVR
jgi:hypothetical protein